MKVDSHRTVASKYLAVGKIDSLTDHVCKFPCASRPSCLHTLICSTEENQAWSFIWDDEDDAEDKGPPYEKNLGTAIEENTGAKIGGYLPKGKLPECAGPGSRSKIKIFPSLRHEKPHVFNACINSSASAGAAPMPSLYKRDMDSDASEPGLHKKRLLQSARLIFASQSERRLIGRGFFRELQHTNGARKVLRAVLGFFLADDTGLGLDPSIVYEGKKQFMTVAGVKYEIQREICVETSIRGRGTVWFLAVHDNKEYVIKDSWIDDSRQVFEHKMLKRVKHMDGREFKRIADEGVSHQDSSLENIISAKDSNAGPFRKAFLIDFDLDHAEGKRTGTALPLMVIEKLRSGPACVLSRPRTCLLRFILAFKERKSDKFDFELSEVTKWADLDVPSPILEHIWSRKQAVIASARAFACDAQMSANHSQPATGEFNAPSHSKSERRASVDHSQHSAEESAVPSRRSGEDGEKDTSHSNFEFRMPANHSKPPAEESAAPGERELLQNILEFL
ncbi:hypothetical protein DFH11DRAFT_1548393 [Phellopilus nigrolimitatus]|nr:hypothetical protein DFH11DRAFT_1548393 [Phellopilus nigrolimitatus]